MRTRLLRNTSLLAATGLLALAACSNSPADESPAASSSSPSATSTATLPASSISSVKLSESIDHVHGLVATGAGSLVAGTHSGAMRVGQDGSVSAQGEQRDDLMGMTGVTDSDQLASSGHPGANSEFPNPLGLVTSADAGKTWSAVSLQGEIDFHSLAISGKNVIGYGGGSTLMISSDGGKTWSDGAALQVAALAYSGDQILATTQTGLQSSKDGGKSFTEVKGSPALMLISAGKGTSVLGLDTGGIAWRSSDNGATWTEGGQVGEVQAIAAYDSTVGYAIDEDRLIIIK